MGISELVRRYGKEEEKAEVALSMHQEGFPIEQIARILKKTTEWVEEIINKHTMLV